MQPHIRNYLNATGKQPDEIMCEKCGATAQDIHHIESRRYANSDNVENLIALCRSCHTWIHSNNNYDNKQMLKDIASKRC